GITVDGYTPGDKSAKFCANYGILFNTPSFKQLAERAFGVRPTKQILFQQPDRDWVDPYRENVTFTSQEAYYTDYDRHIEATRTALEQVEVFIVTLGLNECWSFRDGTVMSRNPRNNMFPFVKHQTLTVQQNVDNIQAFFDIVKKHNPKFKLIISVSPIPFLATGRAEDTHVISANCHSKSVLRVAAEQLIQSNQDMYYLPSYELVMECIEDAWEVDTRHVKRSTVEQVVAMFKQIFIQA
ncbi:MAG: GSCFA domain-containing protein, partial [Psychrosphaera sp.]|nr:GSCFA domain-containing protein [Psychrosphaera sp.]